MSAMNEPPKNSTHDPEPRDPRYKDSIVTVPNVICLVRMVGSFVLFAFALFDWRYGFVGLFLALSLSDWIDGILARWLHQRSDFGARIDSMADAMLYTALIGGALILSWDTLQHELAWIAIGIGSYINDYWTSLCIDPIPKITLLKTLIYIIWNSIIITI